MEATAIATSQNSSDGGTDLRRIVLCAVACLVAGWAVPAIAEDQVILEADFGTIGRMTVTGTVVDYTGKDLRIFKATGDESVTYPAERVVEIRTVHSVAYREGLKLLGENSVAAAVEQFQQAVKQEDRRWVHRDILALLTQCELRLGHWRDAGEYFDSLVRSDPSTKYFHLIPLAWAPQPNSPDNLQQWKQWLVDSSEVKRLIAVSLLLDNAESATGVQFELRQLLRSTDSRIQGLAQALGWRLQMQREIPSRSQVSHWEERVQQLPVELRRGPGYVLGRAYGLRRDYELAALWLLWPVLADSRDHRLAGRSCLEAGQALARIGQTDEANALFAEVTRRYADTPSAGEARQRLQEGKQRD